MEEEKEVKVLDENVESKIEEKKGFLKNKRNLLIIVFIFMLLVIGIIGYFTKFNFVFLGDKKENNENKQQENEIVDAQGSIDVYCKYSGDDCWLTTSSNEIDRFFYKIETETSNPKVLSENFDAILFYDNGLKVFLEKDKKIQKINLENNYNNYDIVVKNNDLIGIVYKNDSNSGYYDYKLNKTIYDNGKLLNDAYNDRYILYLVNDKISIYDKYDSKLIRENINLSSSYSNYDVLDDFDVNENGVSVSKGVLGIFASNDNNSSIYYNSEKNKTLYKDQYSNITQQYKNFLIGSKNLNSGNGDTVNYILDSSEEKILLQPQNPNVNTSFSAYEYHGKYYFIESTDVVFHYYTKGYIYSNDKKLIDSVNYYPGGYNGEDYIINGDGELLIKKDNTINKYNIDGKLLNSKSYDKVINLTIGYNKPNGYLIVVNNEKLIIEDTNFNQLVEIIEWKDNYQFKQYVPRYLNMDSSDDLSNPNHAFSNGVYMVLEDEKNYTEYYFNPENNKVTSRKIDDLSKYELWINWADLS